MPKVTFSKTNTGHGFKLVTLSLDGKEQGSLCAPIGKGPWEPDAKLEKLTGRFQARTLGQAKEESRDRIG